MKIALVHDWLLSEGGGEKVFKEIHTLFPSKIYTLFFNKEALKNSYFSQCEIETSFLQKLPGILKAHRYFLPIFPLSIEQFDLSEYEVIISSSHAVAKGVITRAHQIHICYCHTPMRYAWDLYHSHVKSIKGIKGLFLRFFLHYLRGWDLQTERRVDHFIANSHYVAKRIEKTYQRKAEVIYPPVDIDRFSIGEKKDFYLTVSRLVPYKKVDLIVKAFQKMPEKKLIVIGIGPELKRIQKLASKNVTFLGYQTDKDVALYFQQAKAFVFMAEEDFGIAPVEAMASGTPVIAFGKGGVSETVKPYISGLFFGEQTPESMIEKIDEFENIQKIFDPYLMRKEAEAFSPPLFRERFQLFVNKCRSQEEKK